MNLALQLNRPTLNVEPPTPSTAWAVFLIQSFRTFEVKRTTSALKTCLVEGLLRAPGIAVGTVCRLRVSGLGPLGQ